MSIHAEFKYFRLSNRHIKFPFFECAIAQYSSIEFLDLKNMGVAGEIILLGEIEAEIRWGRYLSPWRPCVGAKYPSP